MLEAHLPLLITLVAALAMAVLIAVLSAVLGPKRPSRIKQQPFECGNPPSGDARERFHVKFHLVAVLFLVFDIEAVFIYPWAVAFHESLAGGGPAPVTLLVEMLIFVAIVVVALAYAWRKGALDWSTSA